jgi:hypothetical protein
MKIARSALSATTDRVTARVTESFAVKFAVLSLQTWAVACTITVVLMLVGLVSFVGATASAAATRYLVLRNTPAAFHAVPITFDFTQWRDRHVATALVVPESRGHPHPDNHAWVSGLQLHHDGQVAMVLQLSVPDDDEHTVTSMLSATMTVIADVPAAESARAAGGNASAAADAAPVERVISRGTASAAVRRTASKILRFCRSVMYFTPEVLFGVDAHVQTVNIPLVTRLVLPDDERALLRLINITVEPSVWSPAFVVLDAKLLVNLQLTGPLSYYFQQYPFVSFAVATSLFFAANVGLGLAGCCALVGYVYVVVKPQERLQQQRPPPAAVSAAPRRAAPPVRLPLVPTPAPQGLMTSSPLAPVSPLPTRSPAPPRSTSKEDLGNVSTDDSSGELGTATPPVVIPVAAAAVTPVVTAASAMSTGAGRNRDRRVVIVPPEGYVEADDKPPAMVATSKQVMAQAVARSRKQRQHGAAAAPHGRGRQQLLQQRPVRMIESDDDDA